MSIKMKRGGIMSLEGVEQTPVGEVDPAAAAIAATPAEGTPLDDTTGGAKGTAEEKVIAAPDTGEELQTTPESAVADGDAIEPGGGEGAQLSVAEEGWKGAALGFVASLFGFVVPGTHVALAGGLSNHAERLKKEIEEVAHELERAALDAGESAVKAGKVSSEDVRKNVKIGIKGIIKGALLGTLFGPIYNAIKGSEVEDLQDELKSKCAQLDRLLKKEAERKGISQEGLEQAAPVVDEAEALAQIAKIVEEVAPAEPTVEQSLVAMEGAVEGVIELDDQVQEAVQVIETVEGINEQLEVAASEEGEGLTPQEAEPIRLAVESMKLRVGYQSEKSVFPAMESFGGKTTKREGAKLALESNRKFVADLKVGVRYAREGMTDKLGEAWGLVFATNDKILARLEEVDGAFSKGEVGSEPIVKPTWGQTLNPESKPTVGAADVISLLQGLADAGESAKLVDGIRAGTEWIKGGCEETGAAGVQEQAEGTEQVVDNAMSEAQASAGEEGDFEPCTAENKDTIVSLIKGLLDTSALKEANDALQAAMGEGECAGADKVLDMVKAGLELHARTAVVASAAVAYLATSVREGASEEAAPAGDETEPAPASTEETTPADGGEAAAADDKKPEEEAGKTE